MEAVGQIFVASTPERGTEFRVYLPAYGGTAPERRTTPASGSTLPAGRARTVLVVDDDDAVRDVAVRALRARSDFSTDELARSGLGSPMRSLVDKPFTLPELTSFVEEAFLAEHEGAI